MTRLLSILLLASFLAGLGGVGAQAADSAAPSVVSPQIAVLGQAGGHSNARMAMECPACPVMGACIAAERGQCVPVHVPRLQFFQPPPQISDQIRAPDTAPPKRFCA